MGIDNGQLRFKGLFSATSKPGFVVSGGTDGNIHGRSSSAILEPGGKLYARTEFALSTWGLEYI
jgi:hypothetical protein